MTKIFLTYASEDKSAAESIAFSLRERGYTVFLDRDNLPPGESFDQQIERAINDSNIFIFLISPDSIAEGRYTLTELTFARHKWQSPSNRVLPVMARKTPREQVPSYLKAVTILEPQGSIAAETSAAVEGMLRNAALPAQEYKDVSMNGFRRIMAYAAGVPVVAVAGIYLIMALWDRFIRAEIIPNATFEWFPTVAILWGCASIVGGFYLFRAGRRKSGVS